MGEVQLHSSATSGTDSSFAECTAIVSAGGIEPALAWLNARTRFRFTGIYLVEPPLLRNVVLFDRENPTLNVSGEVKQLDDTYCALVYHTGPFDTANSRFDDRVKEHTARESVVSYAGVPLRLVNGHVWGTLCHYDLRPRLLPQTERALLESVAIVFSESLQKRDASLQISAPPARARRDSVSR